MTALSQHHLSSPSDGFPLVCLAYGPHFHAGYAFVLAFLLGLSLPLNSSLVGVWTPLGSLFLQLEFSAISDSSRLPSSSPDGCGSSSNWSPGILMISWLNLSKHGLCPQISAVLSFPQGASYGCQQWLRPLCVKLLKLSMAQTAQPSTCAIHSPPQAKTKTKTMRSESLPPMQWDQVLFHELRCGDIIRILRPESAQSHQATLTALSNKVTPLTSKS